MMRHYYFLIQLLLICLLCKSSPAFDIVRLAPIADKAVHTGNKVLYERDLYDNATEDAAQVPAGSRSIDLLDVNDIPVRYDDAQLWRIYNISNSMEGSALPVSELLEDQFGGVMWRRNLDFLDMSFGKDQLAGARSFLEAQQLNSEILENNIQDLIDNEELEGIMATQSEPGHRIKKASRSAIHWKDYHDLDVIYSFMREIRLKFPNICRLYKIGTTAEGRDLKVLRISANPREYKKIWIDGGIHAREWISPATVTFILHQIMSNWERQPAYIKERTWYFMPVMNPDGYVFSRKKNRLWRKNRAPSKRSNCVGVDLNRNFDIGWSGYGSSTNPCSDTYRGTKPASELETEAVVRFLTKRRHNLEAYLTFHSYGQMVVFPWAYKAVKVRDGADLQRVANTAVQRIEQKTGAVYRASVTHELLGIAGGGSDDWCRAALGTKYVYTIELRDRGHYGFVLPPSQIYQTALEGFTIVEAVAQAITLR